MERYYNNMFQQSAASRRKSTAIERLTDPETVTNYLCGYSLRICTLYLLWIHLVFNISVLCTIIIAHYYITIRFNVDTQNETTVYTVTANNDRLFDIDLYSKGKDEILKFISNKLAEVLLSWVILDVVVTIMALCGVYLKNLLLIVPYKVMVFTNIVWFVIFIVVEIILCIFNLMCWDWITTAIITLLLLKDMYRFSVLYSYFHMIGKHCFSTTPRTPQYLSTQSPYRLRTTMDMVESTASTTTTEAPSEVTSAKISLSSQTSDKSSVDKG